MLAQQGFARARIDGELVELADSPTSSSSATRTTPSRVIVDRLVKREGIERRLTDSLETALRLADGVAEVQLVPKEEGDASPRSSPSAEHLACANDGWSMEELAPRNFSFNSPYGACVHCDGLGTKFEVDPELVVPNADLSVEEGALGPLSVVAHAVLRAHPRGGGRGGRRQRPPRRGRS